MTLAAQRRWIMPKKTRDVPDGIPALVAQVLACRGLAAGDMAAFLAARPTEDGPPMLDLDRAVERIRRALAARERIVVYGDYDVDGIAGSAILVRAFRQIGVVVGAYIPNRYEEGYGLNATALRQLAADGAKVVVTGRRPDPAEVLQARTAVSQALLALQQLVTAPGTLQPQSVLLGAGFVGGIGSAFALTIGAVIGLMLASIDLAGLALARRIGS